MNKEYKIKLDLNKKLYNKKMAFNQFDENVNDFYIEVTKNNEVVKDLDKSIVTLVAIKPNGEVDAQFIEVKEGQIYADLKPSMCDLVGNYQAKAMIVLEGEIVTTDTINYSVNEDKIISKLNDDVVSDERFTLFTDALARLSTIELSEEQRQINEAERILSEENRKIEEAKRVEAELIRQHEEADRTKYDAIRESNENIRKQNESIRLANETNRIDEEAKRVEEENKRKLAEEERNANYDFMTEDEERRRSEANAHKEAEALRVQAETNRVNEEAKRRTTEQARVSAENTRVNNENTRETNEVVRKNNENQRIEAETQRQNRYNSFISDAEANASNFENYTNNAKVKEEERKANELDRKTQEDRRISNEVERISNENTRKANEDARIESEKQRVDAENLRKEKIIEIQTDYDSLKKVIIDENANANLQNQINLVNSQLEHIESDIDNLKQNGIGGSIVNTIEPLNDDIPRIFLSEGTLPTTKDSTTMKIEYKSKTKTFSGYVDIKCQGTSSMSYPKKNFTIKLYKDKTKKVKMKQNFRDWGNQNKFCLKANWIDASHARNIVSAKLWGDCVKSRENFEELPIELKTSPNYGAIDGFFVKVYSNGVYQGRYTMNIPKDAWMCNMDKDLDTHGILCGEEYSSGCFQTVNANLWSDELHDTMPTSIAASFENAQRFVINSSDKEFRSNLSDYFDVNSLIDYYCFHYAVCGLDGLGKNQLFLTYDGVHWIASSYDMDSTFGLYWNGASFVSASYRMQEDYESMANGRLGNKLYLRLEKVYAEEIKARYSQLREGALSVSNIINRFEDFMICNTDLINEDFTIFSDIPSQKTNNIQQIRQYTVDRLMYVDNCINNLKPLFPIDEELINNLLASADYKLTEPFVFNGTSDFIDTNIKLFDTIKDFSIYIDYVTPSNHITSTSIFHAMNEVSPYPGINLQASVNYDATGEGWRIIVHPASPNVRRRIILTYTQSTNELVLYHDNDISDYLSVSGIIETPTFRVIEQTALLGCYQTSTGDKGRFWNGTINKCGIWLDKVLTSDEIGTLTN